MRWPCAALLLLLAAPAVCQTEDNPAGPISEDAARSLLYRRIESDALYGAGVPMDCLQFHMERQGPRHFDFIVVPKQEDPCAQARGPYTGVDEFRVMRLNGKLLWYSEQESRFVEYEQAQEFRKR
jgi:hypothetical protein